MATTEAAVVAQAKYDPQMDSELDLKTTTLCFKNEAQFKEHFLQMVTKICVNCHRTSPLLNEVTVSSKQSIFTGRVDAIIHNVVVIFSNQESELAFSRNIVLGFKRSETNPVTQGLLGGYCFLIKSV